ncbi:MAG: NAD(P)/FAD-dependent oxidoreductase [Pirellulales bacterium]|nr:NAD(P)/FAD-dependent oxidoreductase [Pirellulales bacterium]
MTAQYDAIITGAGPAGTSTAHILGRRGYRVLLIDKKTFPRDKACGGGITFKSRKALQKLGLWDTFRKTSPFCAHGYSLYSSDMSEITIRRHDDNDQAAIHITRRGDFDNLLLEAAKNCKNVTFLDGCTAEELLMDNGQARGIRLSGCGHTELHAPLVIDATGVNAALAAKAGMLYSGPGTCALAVRGYYSGMRNLSNVIEIYFDENVLPGYYWIFPLSPTEANIGCGSFQHIIHKRGLNLRKLLENFLSTHPIAANKAQVATLRGKLRGGRIPLAMEHDRSRVAGGFMVVGDAAGFVNPVTAEGIAFALDSGIMAAEAGADALQRGDLSRDSLQAYDRLWMERFGEQFSKSVVFSDGFPPEVYAQYVNAALERNGAIKAAIQDRGRQYELMVKLKAIVKSL